MTRVTVLLAFAGWAAGPFVAYAALSHGLNRSFGGFVALFATYTALVWVVWATLMTQGGGPVAPLAVIGPWAGVALVSVVLYALGAWTQGRK